MIAVRLILLAHLIAKRSLSSFSSFISLLYTIVIYIVTDEQLHQAKVLILDLLGWGVPPEYLVQRGISLALLYTVFTDLRLQLPDSIIADCITLANATTKS